MMRRVAAPRPAAAVPRRGMHAKQRPPPPSSARPSAAPSHPPRTTKPPAPAAPSPAPAHDDAPTPRAAPTASASDSASVSAGSAVLAKNLHRVAGTPLRGADLLGRLASAAEKQNADVTEVASSFRRVAASSGLAALLDEASKLHGTELRDFVAAKLSDAHPIVQRVFAAVVSSDVGASGVADAVKLLNEVDKATAGDNLVLVSSASEERSAYWQQQLAERFASQLGRAPQYLYVQRAGDVDQFELPDGSALANDISATYNAVRAAMTQDVSSLENSVETVNARLQSMQPWVDPSKAAEEIDQLAKSKYARLLDLQLLRPKA